MAKQPKNKIEYLKISDLTTDPKNANLGSERGLRILNDSISDAGLGRSIVTDKHGVIIGGNKTTERSIDRGFEDAVVVHTTGQQLVVVQRDDLDLSDPDPNNAARKLAYYDNVASQHLSWDANRIAADVEAGIDLSKMWTIPELDYVLNQPDVGEVEYDDEDDTSEENARSDGSLLGLIDITIAEPKTQIKHGDIFKLGHHVLICAEVISEWQLWSGMLEAGMLFCPYPGVFVPLSIKADTTPCLLVQPDPYIAGHIVDQYGLVKGVEYVRKA